MAVKKRIVVPEFPVKRLAFEEGIIPGAFGDETKAVHSFQFTERINPSFSKQSTIISVSSLRKMPLKWVFLLPELSAAITNARLVILFEPGKLHTKSIGFFNGLIVIFSEYTWSIFMVLNLHRKRVLETTP